MEGTICIRGNASVDLLCLLKCIVTEERLYWLRLILLTGGVRLKCWVEL